MPGCFGLIGHGVSAPLHHTGHDVDDRIAPLGVAYWTALVEQALPAARVVMAARVNHLSVNGFQQVDDKSAKPCCTVMVCP